VKAVEFVSEVLTL